MSVRKIEYDRPLGKHSDQSHYRSYNCVTRSYLFTHIHNGRIRWDIPFSVDKFGVERVVGEVALVRQKRHKVSLFEKTALQLFKLFLTLECREHRRYFGRHRNIRTMHEHFLAHKWHARHHARTRRVSTTLCTSQPSLFLPLLTKTVYINSCVSGSTYALTLWQRRMLTIVPLAALGATIIGSFQSAQRD